MFILLSEIPSGILQASDYVMISNGQICPATQSQTPHRPWGASSYVAASSYPQWACWRFCRTSAGPLSWEGVRAMTSAHKRPHSHSLLRKQRFTHTDTHECSPHHYVVPYHSITQLIQWAEADCKETALRLYSDWWRKDVLEGEGTFCFWRKTIWLFRKLWAPPSYK